MQQPMALTDLYILYIYNQYACPYMQFGLLHIVKMWPWGLGFLGAVFVYRCWHKNILHQNNITSPHAQYPKHMTRIWSDGILRHYIHFYIQHTMLYYTTTRPVVPRCRFSSIQQVTTGLSIPFTISETRFLYFPFNNRY